VGDFYADKKKGLVYVDPEFGFKFSARRIPKKTAKANGYGTEERPRMGDFRFYLCEPGIITEAMIVEHAPDHGLLYCQGNRVRIARKAESRRLVAKDAEIRYLRFAIINSKPRFEITEPSSAPTGGADV